MPAAGVRRTPVLVAAGGASWEAGALRLLESSADLALQQRAVDVPDLLAAAGTGQAGCALVSASLPGLDADAVAGLRRLGVPVVAVVGHGADRDRMHGIGVARTVPADLTGLALTLRTAAAEGGPRQPDGAHRREGREGGPDADAEGPGTHPEPGPAASARMVAVWGPAGAPGRTTAAVALAAELADRGPTTLLVDADPYGGAVAQHLGVLDEVSGLLAAARQANAGRLDARALAAAARALPGGLRVLTGLPRADRWTEVRPAAFAAVLEAATALADRVVVDTGFCLEDGPADAWGAVRRNETTLAALAAADAVVVVGAADPVGLARLARGLVELRGVVPATPVHLVVNRSRSSLGWDREEVAAMVEEFVRPARLHVWPEDRAGVDRALASGRPAGECAEPALCRGIAELADGLEGTSVRGRGARRLRSRNRAQAPKSR